MLTPRKAAAATKLSANVNRAISPPPMFAPSSGSVVRMITTDTAKVGQGQSEP